MEQLFAVKHSYLIPLLPLLAAAIAGFLCTGSRKKLAHWPIWIGVGISAILSVTLLFGMASVWHDHHGPLAYVQNWYQWITAGPAGVSGTFDVAVGFLFDPLTAVMLCVVTVIGFFITVFAAGYMKGEEGYFRFFAYLGMFIFMMTMLVMGDNFLMLYLGWEGVGLCSYLLIGYYYDRPAARDAAKKAFIVNRIGDFGFGVGIMLTFAVFGTINYFSPDEAGNLTGGALALAADPNFVLSLPEWKQHAIQWIPFMLMLGAFGKSAQFPLYVWLPDAMEGPTPVSALIHAATMVTAGVYMIARCGTLFVGNEAAMWTIAIIGAFTAIFAASIALRQFDLKKVFAYSTISQLGFMFVGVGVLAPVAGVFHLMTHAFFKALLFLSSGVVMHAMLGHLDMRRMSGLKAVLPKTRWLILIGCAALAGVPGLSGFFSKDEIVAAAWHQSWVLGLVLLITAFMTAYYTFRLYFRVFEGPLVQPDGPAEGHSHGSEHDDHGHGAHGGHDTHGHDHGHHNHEPMIMILPLAVLAIGAILAGYVNVGTHHLGDFLGQSPSLSQSYLVAKGADYEAALNPAMFGQHVDVHPKLEEDLHLLHIRMMIISSVVALVGVGLAMYLHLFNRRLSDDLVLRFRGIARVLEGKYWVDEIYQGAIVNPLRKFGQLLYGFDRLVIDGLVWVAGFVPQSAGFVLKLTTQRGQLQGYALTMMLGIVLLLVLVFVF